MANSNILTKAQKIIAAQKALVAGVKAYEELSVDVSEFRDRLSELGCSDLNIMCNEVLILNYEMEDWKYRVRMLLQPSFSDWSELDEEPEMIVGFCPRDKLLSVYDVDFLDSLYSARIISDGRDLSREFSLTIPKKERGI